MVLPIIVPGGDFESGHWHQGPPASRPSPRSRRIQPARHEEPQHIWVMWSDEDEQALDATPATEETSQASADIVSTGAPSSPDAERKLLVHRWRSLLGSPDPESRQATPVASSLPTVGITSAVGVDNSAGLYSDCEWLFRMRSRQRWGSLRHVEHVQIGAVDQRFNWTNPVCEASALNSAAAVWMLWSMYWCGVRHPASLHQKPLHPPTGLMRWISSFHTEQQAMQAREIHRQLDRDMSAMAVRCEWLVGRMVEATNTIALLHELCGS